MKRTPTFALVLAMAVAAAPVAFGQNANPDIGGTWRLNASTLLTGQEVPCEYQGDVPLTQDGDSWTGPADLLLLSGPEACPAEMIGDLTGMLAPGEVAGVTQITGAIDGTDPGGHVTFSGTITNGPAAMTPARPSRKASVLAAKAALQGTGGLSVDQGSFSGNGGTWNAIRLAQSVLDVPELTPVGLTLLVLMLLAGGAVLLRGQQGSA